MKTENATTVADATFHNPQHLTAPTIGVSRGWRLLRVSELKNAPKDAEFFSYFGSGWQLSKEGPVIYSTGLTYRTRTPDPLAAQAGDDVQNPMGLTNVTLEADKGWRFLTKEELVTPPTDAQFFSHYDHSWSVRPFPKAEITRGDKKNTSYRTKAPLPTKVAPPAPSTPVTSSSTDVVWIAKEDQEPTIEQCKTPLWYRWEGEALPALRIGLGYCLYSHWALPLTTTKTALVETPPTNLPPPSKTAQQKKEEALAAAHQSYGLSWLKSPTPYGLCMFDAGVAFGKANP